MQQLQQFLIRQTGTESSSGGGPSSAGPSGSGLSSQANQDSVKFNKKLLDYDYGEDEDDEHKQLSPRGSSNNNVEVITKNDYLSQEARLSLSFANLILSLCRFFFNGNLRSILSSHFNFNKFILFYFLAE